MFSDFTIPIESFDLSRRTGLSTVDEVVTSAAEQVRSLLDEEVEDCEVPDQEDAGQGKREHSKEFEAAVKWVK